MGKETPMLPRAAFPKDRIGMKEFFNWVGVRVYPSSWSDTDIATLDPRLAVQKELTLDPRLAAQQKSHEASRSQARMRATFVSNELHHALANGVLSAEADFCGIKGAPPWMIEMGGEKIYYTVTCEAWVNGAFADWNKGTIEFNSKYFKDYDSDSDLNRIFEDQNLELFAYIRDPERSLGRLVDLTADSLTGISRVTNFRKHLWGELSAVIWLHLALSKSGLSRGDRQKLVELVRDYIDRMYDGNLRSFEPSNSQLWMAVNHALKQFENADSLSSVVPAFAKNRSTSKGPNSEMG